MSALVHLDEGSTKEDSVVGFVRFENPSNSVEEIIGVVSI